MTDARLLLLFNFLCLGLTLVFFWSTVIVLVGLLRRARVHPKAKKNLRFAILICARNEERVIRLPVRSLLMSRYPAALRDVIVLADNCSDQTVARARAAGATVWEKTIPSAGKGDVLAWGIEKIRACGGYDAIAVFDADNIVSPEWLCKVNAALCDGESIVTGCRHSSNARTNLISGWYTIYWNMMNELSNRVRTNLHLSGKLTGTGFAFLLSVLGEEGWKTKTMVEDVEFTVMGNLRGYRVAYVPGADYADEQPVTVQYMWRQLRRWATGGWQVVRMYFRPWVKTLVRHPTLRLFDSFFAILTGMSVAFILLFDVLAFIFRLLSGETVASASGFFFGVIGFVFVMGWFTAWASVALSQEKRRPRVLPILLFPVFSLILSASVLAALVVPTRQWKPIPHGA